MSKLVLEPEEIYQLLAKGDWVQLLNFIKQNPDLIASDDIINHAIKTCDYVFFNDLEKEREKHDYINTLETFHFLHKEKIHCLSKEKFEILIHEIVNCWKEINLEQAYLRAKLNPKDELCQSIIEKYNSSLPKQVFHSQTHSINVIENKNISTFDGRRSLFKSLQEKDFFTAVRKVFPDSNVYPNVALSSVIEFDSVKENLSISEKSYFFKALIDCVVFDHDLFPIYFFELDSSYHDSAEQKQKDGYKDNILSIAGQKLYRIRKIDETTGSNFVQLIRDLLK